MREKNRSRRSALGARQLLLGVGIVVVAYIAVEQGEYGTVALVRQRIERRAVVRAIDSLRREVDSLAKVKVAVASDPAVQERIAREEFGMIKAREILYRFAAPPESAAGARKP